MNPGPWPLWYAPDLGPQPLPPIVQANPLELIHDGLGGVLLIDGLAHLGYAGGSVVRLRDRDGHWVSELVARLEGLPVAFRVEGDDLLVLTHSYRGPGCGNRCQFVLIRVAPDGGLEAID